MDSVPKALIEMIYAFVSGERILDLVDVITLLLDILKTTLAATIFIDGLDEVVEDDRKLIFLHLKNLVVESTANVKLYTSGREDTTE